MVRESAIGDHRLTPISVSLSPKLTPRRDGCLEPLKDEKLKRRLEASQEVRVDPGVERGEPSGAGKEVADDAEEEEEEEEEEKEKEEKEEKKKKKKKKKRER